MTREVQFPNNIILINNKVYMLNIVLFYIYIYIIIISWEQESQEKQKKKDKTEKASSRYDQNRKDLKPKSC